MRKIWFMLLTLCLFALNSCSSNSPDKVYFKLANNYWPEQGAPIPHDNNRFIYIETIDVANFLNRNGIVVQTDTIKYNTAVNNLWISPLYQQLSESIVRDFSGLLPHYFISNESIAAPYATIKLFINGFHGSYTGDAIIKGRWLVTMNNKIYSKAFDRKIPLESSGYDTLVKALSTGWLNEEIDFVNHMKF